MNIYCCFVSTSVQNLRDSDKPKTKRQVNVFLYIIVPHPIHLTKRYRRGKRCKYMKKV